MRPRILLDRTRVPSEEGHTFENYGATYYDEHGHRVVAGQGSSPAQAVADLHRHLERLGYARSNLPKPEWGSPQRRL